MEDFLRFLITPLLSHPDKLQITGSNAALTLKVDDTDVGRVIGKNGHVINAIRTLLHTYSSVRQLPFTNLTLDAQPVPKKESPILPPSGARKTAVSG